MIWSVVPRSDGQSSAARFARWRAAGCAVIACGDRVRAKVDAEFGFEAGDDRCGRW